MFPPRSFTLKPLVVARMLAEITACLVVMSLPVLAILPVHRMEIPPMLMSVLVVLAVGAAVLLPGYGFITYKAATDEDGLTLWSAFKKQYIKWSDISSLSLQTTFGYRRYIVTHTGGEASFPIWFNGLVDLVQIIRAQVPNRARSAAAIARQFKMSLPAIVVQTLKMVAMVVLIVVSWLFFASMFEGTKADPVDAGIILFACVIFTLMLIWRCILMVMGARTVQIDPDGIVVTTWFHQCKVFWTDLHLLNAPPVLVPDGELVAIPGRWFFVSADLEAFDELQEEMHKAVRFRMAKQDPGASS